MCNFTDTATLKQERRRKNGEVMSDEGDGE
jgi:hypothetical protein